MFFPPFFFLSPFQGLGFGVGRFLARFSRAVPPCQLPRIAAQCAPHAEPVLIRCRLVPCNLNPDGLPPPKVIELRGVDHAPEELKGLNFGNKIAILGGDYLLASACTALSRLHHPKVVEMMSDAISAVVEGSSCRTVAALHRTMP